MYLMKPSERAAELQDPGSMGRLGLILAVEGDHTQFLFKLSQARLDLHVGNKLINFIFSPTETDRPFKEEIQEPSSKTQKLQEGNQWEINFMINTWTEVCCVTIPVGAQDKVSAHSS